MLPIRHPYNPVEVIMIAQRRVIPTQMGHAHFLPPDNVIRTYANTLSNVPEARFTVTDKASDTISNSEESSSLEPTNQTISMKKLYESLERKGLMHNISSLSRPESAFLSEGGVSEWRENSARLQNGDLSLKKKTKKPIQKMDPEIKISPNPFKSRCSSAKELLVPIAPKSKINDANVVYAWDPQNQSLSTKFRLENLNKAQIPSMMAPNSQSKPASPLVSSRIPLINNYLFRKMFGQKSPKLPEIPKKS